MSRTVFKISRSTDGNGAVSQHGLVVTEAPRDRLLDRIKPSYRAQHAALRNQVNRSLDDAFKSIRDAKLRRVAILTEPSAHLLRKKLSQQEIDHALACESFDKRLSDFRMSTLELLTELPREELVPIAMATRYSEPFVRELVSYRAITGGAHAECVRNFLNDVREAAPAFALEDLSVLTGEDREQAERIIAMSAMLWQHEHDSMDDGSIPHSAGAKDQMRLLLSKKQFVSPALAVTLSERPKAIEGMPDYLQHFPLPVNEDEAEHFRAFLDVPSRALAVGAL